MTRARGAELQYAEHISYSSCATILGKPGFHTFKAKYLKP
jgi:hypothetical protein